jgi:hypothetical protein
MTREHGVRCILFTINVEVEILSRMPELCGKIHWSRRCRELLIVTGVDSNLPAPVIQYGFHSQQLLSFPGPVSPPARVGDLGYFPGAMLVEYAGFPGSFRAYPASV